MAIFSFMAGVKSDELKLEGIMSTHGEPGLVRNFVRKEDICAPGYKSLLFAVRRRRSKSRAFHAPPPVTAR